MQGIKPRTSDSQSGKVAKYLVRGAIGPDSVFVRHDFTIVEADVLLLFLFLFAAFHCIGIRLLRVRFLVARLSPCLPLLVQNVGTAD